MPHGNIWANIFYDYIQYMIGIKNIICSSTNDVFQNDTIM
jgi:hypothetical protein